MQPSKLGDLHLMLSPNSMTSASTQFASSMRIGGMYDRDHQLGSMWNDPYQVDDSQTTSPSLGDVKLDNPAYIQQLETSRMKLAQLEQELDCTRNQGGYISGHLGESNVGLNGAVNSG
ncbi:transcription factor TGAL6-like, partial [Carex rostrata]